MGLSKKIQFQRIRTTSSVMNTTSLLLSLVGLSFFVQLASAGLGFNGTGVLAPEPIDTQAQTIWFVIPASVAGLATLFLISLCTIHLVQMFAKRNEQYITENFLSVN